MPSIKETIRRIKNRKYDKEFAKKYTGPWILYIEPDSDEESEDDYELDEEQKKLSIDILNEWNFDLVLGEY